MANFIDLIYYLESWGVSDVIIPFFLVFTVVFAVLQRSKILGKDQKRFNVILALTLALAVVIPHIMGAYPPGGDIVLIMNASLPQIAAVLVGIIMIMLLLGVTGQRWQPQGSGAGVVAVIAAAIVIYIFGTNAGWFYSGNYPYWLWWLSDPETQSLLVGLLIFGLVLWAITRDKSSGGEGSENKGLKNLLKGLGNLEEIED